MLSLYNKLRVNLLLLIYNFRIYIKPNVTNAYILSINLCLNWPELNANTLLLITQLPFANRKDLKSLKIITLKACINESFSKRWLLQISNRYIIIISNKHAAASSSYIINLTLYA